MFRILNILFWKAQNKRSIVALTMICFQSQTLRPLPLTIPILIYPHLTDPTCSHTRTHMRSLMCLLVEHHSINFVEANLRKKFGDICIKLYKQDVPWDNLETDEQMLRASYSVDDRSYPRFYWVVEIYVPCAKSTTTTTTSTSTGTCTSTTLANLPQLDRPTQHYPISVPKTGQIRSKTFCQIKKMIVALCLLLCCLGSTISHSIFDYLPPIITDQSNQKAMPPSTHQFLFQPIGKFSTDVHYMHIQIPIYFTPVFENLAHFQKTMTSLLI